MSITVAKNAEKYKANNNVLFFALLLVFIISPLPLGSNREWAYFGLSAYIFLLVALHSIKTVFVQLRTGKKFKQTDVDVSCVLIGLVAVWLFIQSLVQIPLEWLRDISPVSYNYYSLAFNALGVKESVGLVTLSLDRTETFNSAILTLGCLGVVYLMEQLIKTKKQLKVFCYTIVLSGCFQAIYGIMMTLTGVEYLFFVPKSGYFGNATGTFVNRNHLAGYLEMTLSVGIGLLLMLRSASAPESGRWNMRMIVRKVLGVILSEIAIVRCILIIMVVGLIMTHSRMGNVAFFNAFLIISVFAIIVSRFFRNTGFYIILTSIISFDIFIIGKLFDINKVVERLEKTAIDTEARIDTMPYIMNMIPDFWLTGSGAGTFVYVFPAYIEKFYNEVIDFAHNDFAQIIIEFGVIGFVPLALYVGLSFIRSLKLIYKGNGNLHRGMGFAVAMGCISIMLHSATDFNLQIPANIILFVALLKLSDIVSKLNKA